GGAGGCSGWEAALGEGGAGGGGESGGLSTEDFGGAGGRRARAQPRRIPAEGTMAPSSFRDRRHAGSPLSRADPPRPTDQIINCSAATGHRFERHERAVNDTPAPVRIAKLVSNYVGTTAGGNLIAVTVMSVEGPMSIVAVVVMVPVERPIVAVVVMPVVAVATPGRRRLTCRSCQTHGKDRHRCVRCKLQHGPPPQMLAQMFSLRPGAIWSKAGSPGRV